MMLDLPIHHECYIESKFSLEDRSWVIPIQSIAKNHLYVMDKRQLDQNWGLSDFFGSMVVINLPEAKERLRGFTNEMNSIGASCFEVFKAINGRRDVDSAIWNKFKSNREHYDVNTEEGRIALDSLHQGEAGCYLSHYQIIKKTKEAFDAALLELDQAKKSQDASLIDAAKKTVRRYSSVLIFEDDAGFGVVDKKTSKISKRGIGTNLRKALSELPLNWDMVYLMAFPKGKPEKASRHLYKLKKSYSNMAYAVNHTMYEPLLIELQKIENPDFHEILPLDNAISSIHQFYSVYLISPTVAYQRSGKSDISHEVTDYPWQWQLKK